MPRKSLNLFTVAIMGLFFQAFTLPINSALASQTTSMKAENIYQRNLTLYTTAWSEYGGSCSSSDPNQQPYQYDGAYNACMGSWNNRPKISNAAMVAQFNQATVVAYSFMQVWNPSDPHQNKFNIPAAWAGNLHFSDIYGELPPSSDTTATNQMMQVCQTLGTASCSDIQMNGNTNQYQLFSYLQDQTTGQFNSFNAFMNLSLNSNVKRIIAIGGANTPENNSVGYMSFQAIFNNQTTFIHNLQSWMTSYPNLKGIDYDFEPPIDSTGAQLAPDSQTLQDYKNLLSLVIATRSVLPNAYISVTLTANLDYLNYLNKNLGTNWFQQLANNVDAVNIMTYDFHGPWSTQSDPNTAIHSVLAQPTIGNQNQFAINYGADAVLNKVQSFGVPASKLQMGIASYARIYAGVPAGDNAQFPGFNQPWKSPATIVAQTPGLLAYKFIHDPNVVSSYQNYDVTATVTNSDGDTFPGIIGSYLYNPNNQIFVGYESTAEINSVCHYINNNNLQGAILWSADTDNSNTPADSLITAYRNDCQ